MRNFHDHPAYVKAIARAVNDYWMKHGRPDRLVMSFHGLPRFSLDRGDPYHCECHKSARLIATELGWNDERTIVTFQSRFGAAEWLKPYTGGHARRSWAAKGMGRVDVICPGFAADCLETLEEIAMEGRDTFLAAGGKEFHYIPTTNDSPAFMAALTRIALENLHGWASAEWDAQAAEAEARAVGRAGPRPGREELTRRHAMGSLLLRWLLSALALLAVAYLYPGVRVESFFAAAMAALAWASSTRSSVRSSCSSRCR